MRFFLVYNKSKTNLTVKVLKFKKKHKETNSYGFLHYIMNILTLSHSSNKNVHEMLYIPGEF